MREDQLTTPIGALMRPTEGLQWTASLQVAADRLREEGSDLLPVVGDGKLLGVVTQASLGRCLGDGVPTSDAVTCALVEEPATIYPWVFGAEALRAFSQTGGASLVVVDADQRVLGTLAPAELFPRSSERPRPPLVGGMATPFGVYLTTGAVRAGVSDLGLVATGAMLFLMFAAAVFGASYLATALLPEKWSVQGADAMSIALFLLTMRAVPLAGIHAAEHKVVHAIERGEELAPEIVSRMPRVHPRCGTNIAVAVSIFIGIGTATWLPQELQLVVALIATLALWRPVGSLVQWLVTTRPPSLSHIQMGIRSAEELLDKYARAVHGRPTIWRRLWCSGMFHVIGGSFLAFGAVWAVGRLFGLDVVL